MSLSLQSLFFVPVWHERYFILKFYRCFTSVLLRCAWNSRIEHRSTIVYCWTRFRYLNSHIVCLRWVNINFSFNFWEINIVWYHIKIKKDYYYRWMKTSDVTFNICRFYLKRIKWITKLNPVYFPRRTVLQNIIAQSIVDLLY